MGKAIDLAPKWPPGPVPWVILTLYTASLAVAFIPPARDLYGLAQLYNLGLSILRTQHMVQKVMKAATVAHGLEALVTIAICCIANIRWRHTLGWAGLTLLLGYGAILPLQRGIKAQQERTSRQTAAKQQ